MRLRSEPSTVSYLARGVVAGLVGTVGMTAFQKSVEMPITQRGDSFAPAEVVAEVTPASPKTPQEWRRLNYVTHFALGAVWGAAYGVAAQRGLRGQRAVLSVFGVVYSADVALNVALGVYQPTRWSAQDVVVDVLDKFAQGQLTGKVFDKLLDPAR